METQNLSIPVITIDGGAGTGKSTHRAKVAALLGFNELNSGAFYRALGLTVARHECDIHDIERIVAFARTLPVTFKKDRIFLENIDSTNLIYSDETGKLASAIAQIPEVRASFKVAQLAMRQLPGLVADGRDMGTVFDTPYRFFITTAPEESARRRVAQFKNMGIEKSYEDVLRDIISRDESDRDNPANPLRPHSDAKIIDNTHLKADDVVEIIIDTYCAHA